MKKVSYQHSAYTNNSDKVVTGIVFNNETGCVSIVIEQNMNAEKFSMSIQKAIEIGFINLDALNLIFKNK